MDFFKTINQSIWDNETHFYVEDIQLYVGFYSDHLCMIDITNAGKQGKECVSLAITPKDRCNVWWEVKNHFEFKMESNDLKKFFDDNTKDIEWELNWSGQKCSSKETDEERISFYMKKGSKIFSPFAQVNKIKKEPKKWTKKQVVNAVLNGQFTDMMNEDKPCNTPMKLVEDVIENSKWSVSSSVLEGKTIVEVRWSYLETYNFVFDIDANTKAFEYVLEKRKRLEREREIEDKKRFESINTEYSCGVEKASLKHDKKINRLVWSINGKAISTFSKAKEKAAYQAKQDWFDEVYNSQKDKFEIVSRNTKRENVELYISEKVNSLEDHFSWLNDDLRCNPEKQQCHIVETIVLGNDNFQFLQDNFMHFNISDFLENNFSTTLPEELNIFDPELTWEELNEEQRAYYNKHRVMAVTRVIKEGSTDRYFINSGGYKYARIVGTQNKDMVI